MKSYVLKPLYNKVVSGLPVGLSFFSTAYHEPALIKFAYAFEHATQVRRPPQFQETVHF